MRMHVCYLLAAFARCAVAYDTLLAFNEASSSIVEVETRSIDEIYDAALAEGGVVTLWFGGDSPIQQQGLKEAFEKRFPKVTLNLTVDLSKYFDGEIDRQLAINDLYVDSAMLQTLQDFPRWDQEDALLHYKPVGFDSIYEDFRNENGAFYGVRTLAWSNIWNTNKLGSSEAPMEYTDYLNPVFRNKLVLTHPNDDDAVLFQFYMIMNQYGIEWFDGLLAQNPHWVRGTATSSNIVAASNRSAVATFTAGVGLVPTSSLNVSFPVTGQFVVWPQTGAIFKNAKHKEGAKLLHNCIISPEYQRLTGSWSVRKDVNPPPWYPDIFNMPGTDPTKFFEFMLDRERVERLRFWFENRIGTPQGPSPLLLPINQ